MKNYLQLAASYLDQAQRDFASSLHLKHAATVARILSEVYQLQVEYNALFEGGHPLKESGVFVSQASEEVTANKMVRAVPRYEANEEAIEVTSSYRGPWSLPEEVRETKKGKEEIQNNSGLNIFPIIGKGSWLSGKYIMELHESGEARFFISTDNILGPATPVKTGGWTIQDDRVLFSGFEDGPSLSVLISLEKDLNNTISMCRKRGISIPVVKNNISTNKINSGLTKKSILEETLRTQGIDV